MQIRVKPGQSLHDVALMVYGSIEGIDRLIIDNPAITINTSLAELSLLTVGDNLINAEVKNYLEEKSLVVNSQEVRIMEDFNAIDFSFENFI